VLSDTQVYEPQIRALLGTAAHTEPDSISTRNAPGLSSGSGTVHHSHTGLLPSEDSHVGAIGKRWSHWLQRVPSPQIHIVIHIMSNKGGRTNFGINLR